jgi:hypothetical protein
MKNFIKNELPAYAAMGIVWIALLFCLTSEIWVGA